VPYNYTEVKKTIEVKAEAPPIPLWKVGLLLLAVVGGAGAYYLIKGGKK
jgi:hypothetical protein